MHTEYTKLGSSHLRPAYYGVREERKNTFGQLYTKTNKPLFGKVM